MQDADNIATSEHSRDVTLVIYPGFKAMEAIGPLSVFSYANRHLHAAGHSGRYDVSIAAPTIGPVRSDTLMTLEATSGLCEDKPLATVLIVGAADIEGALSRETALVNWCRRRAGTAERFAALCTGSFFLAAAGLLEGRRTATHWNYAAQLQQRFPSLQVDADAIFVEDGTIWTSAGVTAAIDLALAFVEQDFGRDIALQVARDMVIYLKRPGGQSQFSTALTSQMRGATGMRDVETWMMTRLDNALTLKDMAGYAGMSVRSFTRAFTAELGVSPMVYLEQLRCERAKTLLLDTDLPLKSVAFKAGFSSDTQMRKVFSRRLSLTPREYRLRFNSAA